MKLSVLIATQGRRRQKLRLLLSELLPQLTKDTEVVLYQNNGEEPIGFYRKSLVEASHGKYVCFVDDDDRLPDYYIDEILSKIKQKPDYIGFEVKLYLDGREERRVLHSMRYHAWFQDNDAFYRNVTHLNPIKRELALQGEWPTRRDGGEDVSWANSVKSLVQTEEYIDRVMYYYHHDSVDTSFGGAEHTPTTRLEPGIIYL